MNRQSGMVDGQFVSQCTARGFDIHAVLSDNDLYTLLKEMDALLITGPTGTNVNDLAVALIR